MLIEYLRSIEVQELGCALLKNIYVLYIWLCQVLAVAESSILVLACELLVMAYGIFSCDIWVSFS